MSLEADVFLSLTYAFRCGQFKSSTVALMLYKTDSSSASHFTVPRMWL